MMCEFCEEVKEDVEEVEDPYVMAMYDRSEKIKICYDCLKDRIMGI